MTLTSRAFLHPTRVTHLPGLRVTDVPGSYLMADILPRDITDIKNAKGEVFKSVHTPPSAPHGGMEFHTHGTYRNVLPDGIIRSGVSKGA